MNKLGAVLIILLGVIFALITLNVISGGLVLLSDNEKDINGVDLLASYWIPGLIVATISFLLLRFGIRMLKKKVVKENKFL